MCINLHGSFFFSFNEYRPRKLEWYEGKADAHVDTGLTRMSTIVQFEYKLLLRPT